MKNSTSLTIITLLLAVSNLSAATLYVSLESTNPTPPYTNWVTAATNIQDAVNVAATNDVVMVTNGVYPGGVSVTSALALLSVNGPQFTIIDGGGRIQCAYLTNGASLTGFTLTNGYIYADIWDVAGGGGVECAASNAFVTNCLVVGDSSSSYGYGGGAFGGTFYNCTLNSNSADVGGGAYGCTLYNCTLSGNSARFYGGGGADSCTLYNCALTGNDAAWGGGADSCTLYNCTLTGNDAQWGGGANSCELYNCIIYFNTASREPDYDSSSTLRYCCTTPLHTAGVGNLALDPQLASASHLSADSPCRGAGSASYATGTDIDGEPWANPPCIGCDEYHVGAVTGPLAVGLVASDTNVLVGYAVSLTALIEGRTTQSVWDFGDGVVVSNRPYVSHAWAAPGDYPVALRAYNEANVAGVSATVSILVITQPVLFVAVSSPNPQPPYASWATAARNIQDAVNAASFPRAAVLVTNGVYPGGVAVAQPLTLRSVNGPESTIINGGGTSRCIHLTEGASLTGFTLTNGFISNSYGGGVHCGSTSAFLTNCLIVGNSTAVGGGVCGCTLYNCILSGNLAAGGYGYGGGGGAYGSTLYNCTLSGNSAGDGDGGGAGWCTLYNCTLTGNSTPYGGGGVARSSTLYNCIVYSNTASGGANYDASSTLNYCCTTPLPANGVRNITSDPLFVDYASGNLRLQSNSPCINAGNNGYADTANDLDGNPRVVSGTVDIGAYEYQGTGSMISYAWLQQYDLPTDGSADYADPDHDGLNNWQEWICGTNPTNAVSALRMLSAMPTPTNTTVTWQSTAGVKYFLQRSANLASPFSLSATSIVGQAGSTSFVDTNGIGAGPFFYRVGVGSQ